MADKLSGVIITVAVLVALLLGYLLLQGLGNLEKDLEKTNQDRSERLVGAIQGAEAVKAQWEETQRSQEKALQEAGLDGF